MYTGNYRKPLEKEEIINYLNKKDIISCHYFFETKNNKKHTTLTISCVDSLGVE